jgi:uncharacterized membrane protein
MTTLFVLSAGVFTFLALIIIGLYLRAHQPRHTAEPNTNQQRANRVLAKSSAHTSALHRDLEGLRGRRDDDERLQRQADDLDRIAENRKRAGGRP